MTSRSNAAGENNHFIVLAGVYLHSLASPFFLVPILLASDCYAGYKLHFSDITFTFIVHKMMAERKEKITNARNNGYKNRSIATKTAYNFSNLRTY